MTRILAYALIAALAAVIALGGVSWMLQARSANLQRELTLAQAVIAQHQKVADVHRAHIKRLQAEADKWSKIENDLNNMDGGDAALSDFLRAGAGRVWP